MRVVIVGSGVAGLVTALALGDRHDVTIVTKSTIDESNTRYAQGGIAAAVMPGDTVDSHVADTLVAGAGLSDPAAVQVLCAEGPARIRDLIRWGVDFDRQHDDPAADFDAGLEGAHSFHRILHAGGDATGYEVEWALVRAVRASATRVLEQTFVADLVVTDGCATGLTVLRDGIAETLTADAVVLASGGIGQLYPHTTNPSVTTGDGAAAALRAGAVLADVEFVQFHPTALAVSGSFLVSEAVRGDGAVLRNASGERFMVGEHPLAELAPRDVVARAIASEMARTGKPVVLDATAIGAAELERRFPTISAAAREHGFDWAHEPVPVAPAAHYWMGGVATDLDGRTSIPGLFAVGEVSCTGVHGANRLASNSLLESLVFAHRAAAAIRSDAAAPSGAPRLWSGLPNTVPLERLARAGVPAGAESPESDGMPATVTAFLGDSVTTVATEAGDASARVTREPSRAELHTLMWRDAGVHRDAAGLREARDTLAGWDLPVAADASIQRRETANLLQLARAIVAAALAREESRGAHFRADHPDAEPPFAHHITVQAPLHATSAGRDAAPAPAPSSASVTPAPASVAPAPARARASVAPAANPTEKVTV
ncbi:L-aspartate oxidase [Herbiconiux ginsengi]|uniref:L-aspartate oxidase n=1 Tax=Herbiconiux ginsengi TaxID=381665 RepID=A0A1H3MJP5_9MICO|nr:L-aspartate oxidase [Herbiconiux ginsengi]SDY76638.1 L-aspartate oxidase [Herbiconiux ginsengi]